MSISLQATSLAQGRHNWRGLDCSRTTARGQANLRYMSPKPGFVQESLTPSMGS